jgi:hypothetical protein
MGIWEFLVKTAECVAAGSVLLLMGWAAIERARIRRRWLRLQGEVAGKSAPLDWYLATSVLAGCV